MNEDKRVERYGEALGQGGRRTLALALLWALALAAGIVLNRLEIFLLCAPLSAGLFLLVPHRL